MFRKSTASSVLLLLLLMLGTHVTEGDDIHHEDDHGLEDVGYGYYGHDLELVMKTGAEEYGLKVDHSHDGANITDMLFRLDLYEAPGELDHDNFVSIPLFLAPVCVAYNLQNFRRISAPLENLGYMLLGEKNFVISDTDNDTPLMSGSLSVVLGPRNESAMNSLLARAFHHYAHIPAFDVAGEDHFLPSKVFANSKVMTASDDSYIGELIKATPDSIGFISTTAASEYHLPCMPLQLVDDLTVYRLVPKLHPHDGALYEVEENEHAAETSGSHAHEELISWYDVQLKEYGFEYPLLGPLLVTVNRTAICASVEASEHFMDVYRHLLTDDNSTIHVMFHQWGFASVDAEVVIDSLEKLNAHICLTGDFTPVRSGGASAPLPAMQGLAVEYLGVKSVFFDYVPTSSATALQLMKDDQMILAGSGLVLSTQELQDHSHLRQIPMISFSVSLIFNLGGNLVHELVISLCVLVPILRGEITYWDDEAIQEDNPTIVLPHAPICIVSRSGGSNQHQIITTGLSKIDAHCHNTNTSSIVPSTLWETNGFKTTLAVASTEELMHEVVERDFCMGYAPTPSAEEHGLHSVTLEDPDTHLQSHPTTDFILPKLETASRIDTHSMTYELSVDTRTYPFVGTTYWTFNDNYVGNFSAVKEALLFVKWTLENSHAREVIHEHGYVSWPLEVSKEASEFLEMVKVDGVYVFPPPPPPPEPFPYWVIAIIVVVVAAAIFAAYYYYTRFFLVRAAPKHSRQPFTVLFVGPKNSSDLSHSTSPEIVSAVLDHLSKKIAKVCAKTGCYRVKRVGEHTMIAARSPHNALRFAVEMERLMLQTNWERSFEEASQRTSKAGSSAGSFRSKRSVLRSPSSVSGAPGDTLGVGRGSSRKLKKSRSQMSNNEPGSPESTGSGTGIAYRVPSVFSPHAEGSSGGLPRSESAMSGPGSSKAGGGSKWYPGKLMASPSGMLSISSAHSSKLSAAESELQLCYGIDHGRGHVAHDKQQNTYDYSGTVVETAAFVSDHCNGHQILLSVAAEEVLQNKTADGPSLADVGQIVNYASVTKDDKEFVLKQLDGSGLPRRTFEPPKEGAGDSSVMSALEQSRSGITKKRVGVLAVYLVDFIQRVKDLPRDEVPKKHDAVYCAVQEIVAHNRGHIASFVDGLFTITFNVVTPCGSHVTRAGTCALEVLTVLSSEHGCGTMYCGLASGTCLVGTRGKIENSQQVLLGTLTSQARLLSMMCAEYPSVMIMAPSSISIHELSSAFLYESIDLVCPRHPSASKHRLPSPTEPAGSWPTMFALYSLTDLRPTSEEGADVEWLYEFSKEPGEESDWAAVTTEAFQALLKGDMKTCAERFESMTATELQSPDGSEAKNPVPPEVQSLGLEALRQIREKGDTDSSAFYHAPEYATEKFHYLMAAIHANFF